jgi:hypothetical protein
VKANDGVVLLYLGGIMRTLLAAFAVVLAMAGTAWADCGWILWSLNKTIYLMMLEDRRTSNLKLRLNWDRLDAFDTKAQCVAMLETRAQKTREYRESGEEAKMLRELDQSLGRKPGTARPANLEETCWPVGANPWPSSMEKD